MNSPEISMKIEIFDRELKSIKNGKMELNCRYSLDSFNSRVEIESVNLKIDE